MTYGYCRVSTKKQSLERQIKNILKYDNKAKLYTEKYTGTTIDRVEFNKLLKVIKSGDTIIFDSVSRMSRTAEEGTELYFNLMSKGVNLVFLNEPYINTDTYKQSLENEIATVGNEIADMYIETTNRVLRLLATKQIRIAFDQAEKEVKDIQERVKQGMRESGASEKISASKTDSKYTTKKSLEKKEKILKLSKSFNGSLTDVELLELLAINRNTLYKYKKELREEMCCID